MRGGKILLDRERLINIGIRGIELVLAKRNKGTGVVGRGVAGSRRRYCRHATTASASELTR